MSLFDLSDTYDLLYVLLRFRDHIIRWCIFSFDLNSARALFPWLLSENFTMYLTLYEYIVGATALFLGWKLFGFNQGWFFFVQTSAFAKYLLLYFSSRVLSDTPTEWCG